MPCALPAVAVALCHFRFMCIPFIPYYVQGVYKMCVREDFHAQKLFYSASVCGERNFVYNCVLCTKMCVEVRTEWNNSSEFMLFYFIFFF